MPVKTKIRDGKSSLKTNGLSPRKEMATGKRSRFGKTAKNPIAKGQRK